MRPPTHTAANTMCSPKAVIAVSWSPGAEAACPCSDIGIRAATEATASSATPVCERTAMASTVISAAARVVASQDCPRAIEER